MAGHLFDDILLDSAAACRHSGGMPGFQKLLAATDFSPHGEAAARQGLWLAQRTGAHLTVVHVLADIAKALRDAPALARSELTQGDMEVFQREVRRESDQRLKELISRLAPAGPEPASGELAGKESVGAAPVVTQPAGPQVRTETLLGEPFVEIIHAVQAEGHDLVLTGTRGLSGWKRLLVGSTATRLVRKCPAAVWVVRGEGVAAPRAILAATDFSDASRPAMEQAWWLAGLSGATLYVMHTIDERDTPDNAFEKLAAGTSRQTLRRQIRKRAGERLQAFIEQIMPPEAAGNVAVEVTVEPRLTWGTPWREIVRLAKNLKVDLVAMGTVGRSGIPGLLLGNTAEKVLSLCETSILSVKPAGFVSPIAPPFWSLHPEAASTPPG